MIPASKSEWIIRERQEWKQRPDRRLLLYSSWEMIWDERYNTEGFGSIYKIYQWIEWDDAVIKDNT